MWEWDPIPELLLIWSLDELYLDVMGIKQKLFERTKKHLKIYINQSVRLLIVEILSFCFIITFNGFILCLYFKT